jgi:hypothetical protein
MWTSCGPYKYSYLAYYVSLVQPCKIFKSLKNQQCGHMGPYKTFKLPKMLSILRKILKLS